MRRGPCGNEQVEGLEDLGEGWTEGIGKFGRDEGGAHIGWGKRILTSGLAKCKM
jgi:hypothetical protein